MCCHKKCVNKCQLSTVCGDDTQSTISSTLQPEFKVTEPESPMIEVEDFVDLGEEPMLMSRLETHRQSFSDLLAQGLKRVNSASNLAIPMGPGKNQSKSLPPSPQHTPRKQSLANVNANPFAGAIQKLETLPNNILDLNTELIVGLTELLIEHGSSDSLMAMAKSTSRLLYADLESEQRVDKINSLVSVL